MEYLKLAVSLIGLAIVAALGVAFVFFFGLYFIAMIAAMVVLFGIAWALGVPITIKQDGVKVGYVRWLTFHRTQNGQTPS